MLMPHEHIINLIEILYDEPSGIAKFICRQIGSGFRTDGSKSVLGSCRKQEFES